MKASDLCFAVSTATTVPGAEGSQEVSDRGALGHNFNFIDTRTADGGEDAGGSSGSWALRGPMRAPMVDRHRLRGANERERRVHPDRNREKRHLTSPGGPNTQNNTPKSRKCGSGGGFERSSGPERRPLRRRCMLTASSESITIWK